MSSSSHRKRRRHSRAKAPYASTKLTEPCFKPTRRPTGVPAPWEAPTIDARTLPAEVIEPFLVFHHVAPNAAPVLYRTPAAPELKGGFARFVDEKGVEHWISGAITIKRDGSRG